MTLTLPAPPSVRYVDWYKGVRKQTHQTPPDLFAKLHAEFAFTMDGAAERHNRLLKHASTWAKPLPWAGERVFCNPPWSGIGPFVELAATAEFACLLVPARTNCRWFHRAIALGATVRFFLGKPKFVGNKSTSPVNCVLLLFGNAEPREVAV